MLLTQMAEPKFASHALFILDIALAVCRHIEVADGARLLRTCRAIFPVAASCVWETVHDHRALLGLIDPQDDLDGDDRPDRRVERFNLYAPFIKHLNFPGLLDPYFDNSVRPFYDRDIRPFLNSCLDRHILLPNLVSLVAWISEECPKSDQLIWITKLISPSLQKFELKRLARYQRSWVSCCVASNVLSALSTTCRAIEKLAIMPSDDEGVNDPIIENASPDMVLKDLARSFFQSNRSLCNLTIGVSLLGTNSLQTLGSLPCLESLTILSRGERLLFPQSSIPITSFPALKELSLIGLDIDNLVGLLGLNSLVRPLTSLRLCIEQDWQNYGEQLFAYDLPLVLRNTPSLRRFICDVSSASLQPTYISHSADLLSRIFQLRLEEFAFVGIEISAPSLVDFLTPTWIELTTLEMLDQHVTLSELAQFAKLPNLKHLTLSPLFIKAPEVWSTQCTSLQTFWIESLVTYDNPVPAREAARYFLHLWPNLAKLRWTTRGMTLQTIDPDILSLHDEYFYYFNHELQLATEERR
ncbi:hypothetical protein BDV93DRAFT_555597 [Ceratobasidium sp. AG-I]|nr:hypothetical protein BDV93DRAFT_555597 [Ceratobasidium sp. AG-I]